MTLILTMAVLVALFAQTQASVSAPSADGYDLTWNTVDSGGYMFSAGGSYSLGGTIGQPDAGAMSASGYTLSGGLWQDWGTTPVASLIVNTLADSDIDDAYCSLREAIIAANTNAAYHGCAVGSGDDTITFSVSGTITLIAALPDITSNLNINGPGMAVLVVSGGGTYRIFDVTSPVAITLQNLTVWNGHCSAASPCGGAGIRIAGGALSIVNTKFLSNTVEGSWAGSYGGAILADGTVLTISHSIFSGNAVGTYGGAIYAKDGLLTMDDSTLDWNAAHGSGGALDCNGARGTIVNSTFTHNSTAGTGGAVLLRYSAVVTITHSTFYSNTASSGEGGSAVYNNGSTLVATDTTFSSNQNTALSQNNDGAALTLSNSTFSDNKGEYGASALACGRGTCAVTNSTFANNVSGPAISGYPGIAFTILNGTIAGNTAGGFYRVPGVVTNTIVANNGGSGNCSESTITNGGNNLDSGATCGFGAANGSLSNTDPLLGSPADNGGPTLTMAPSPQSPAIDGVIYNAPNGCPATDQRGVARPIDGDDDGSALCDIGAYEAPTWHGYAIYLPLILR